jgi:DNA repair exonuclease SbcCD ATPase subunit
VDYDPLQYFDEEYSSLQNSFTTINSLLMELRDIHRKINLVQKRISELSSHQNSFSESFSDLLLLFSDLLSSSSALVDSLKSFKSSINPQQ